MLVDRDLPISELLDIEIMNRFGTTGFQIQLQHLIEIAIVQLPVPANGNRVAAHQSLNRSRIECINQRLHVRFQLANPH